MSSVTLYHNPRCSNSRGALEIIRAAGIEPHIVEYLDTPPDAETLGRLLAAMGLTARDLIREKEAPYTALELSCPQWSEDALIDIMCAHPVLINRPIVVTPKGTRLCRPPERVIELL